MCGTEQSKILLERESDQDFKRAKEEEEVKSPYEQYMRSKEEA
jgi:hypothetical protein